MKILIATLLVFSTSSLQARPDENFKQFLKELKLEMIQDHGYSESLVNKAFKGVRFNQSIIDADRSQPEFISSYGGYLKRALSKKRIEKGQKYIVELKELFKDIYSAHPVQERFLLSFWALETNFSGYTGYIDVVEALATLIYDGRRARFFKEELIAILKVLSKDNFEYPGNRIQGSWAGAIGSTQFLPSKILKYAIDFNQDGIINMWESKPDFLASSAKFLEGEGWDGSEHWGHSVKLPEGFDYFNSGLTLKKKVDFWRKKNVTLANGDALPDSDNLTALYMPQGHKGPKFLVYNNYFKVFRWNSSAKYALAIGIMSDSITKQATYWDQINFEEKSFLSFQMIKDIQTKLNQLGFGAGRADGIFGQKSYRALQKYQKSVGLIADGYLTKKLVTRLLK